MEDGLILQKWTYSPDKYLKTININCVASQDTATFTASRKEVRQSLLGANDIKLNTLGGENPYNRALFDGYYTKNLNN